MEQTILQFKKTSVTSKKPLVATENSAGADLYANIDKTTMIRPNGYFGALVARSGISTKRGLAPINCVGIIDSDYRGEIMVPLHNHSEQTQIIEPDERIAQLIILPYLKITPVEVETLNATNRGNKGFGSTGK